MNDCFSKKVKLKFFNQYYTSQFIMFFNSQQFQMWYWNTIKQIYQNLTFEIVYSILLLLCIILHSIKQSTEVKNNLFQPTLLPYQSIAAISAIIQFLASFVSIGLWVQDSEFWVFWLFSLISFLCYGLLIILLTTRKNNQFKLCCIPINQKKVTIIRLFSVFANLLLAFYSLAMLWIPCEIIDEQNVIDHEDNKTFKNCLYVILGAFLCTVSFHIIGAIEEFIIYFIYLSRRKKQAITKPEDVITNQKVIQIQALDNQNKQQVVTVQYDVSDE